MTAFNACYRLTNIIVSEKNTAYKSIDGNLYSKDGATLVRYAIGKRATSFTIPDGVTSIGSYAFESHENLRNIIIPDCVERIGYYAFFTVISLARVYYKGTANDWAHITIGSYGNDDLTSAMRYYYIENEVDVPTDGGNYWRYVDGVPTAW